MDSEVLRTVLIFLPIPYGDFVTLYVEGVKAWALLIASRSESSIVSLLTRGKLA
jgi:hypothetical protein